MKYVYTFASLIILFLISPFVSKTQDSLLRIYKFRTPGFRALQLDLNLNGGFDESKKINAPDAENSNFSTSPSIRYFRIVSTDKRQYVSNIYFVPRLNYSKNENNGNKITNRNSGADFRWDFINRSFYKKDLFLEIGNILESNNTFNRNTSPATKFKAVDYDLSNQLIIGAGKGRLENVQDAQMALFIINDLRRMGLLTGEPDAATLYQLAALITDINNQRVFDNRIRRIYELTRIDSLLQKKGLINQVSIAYFTTVNDNWALAFNPGRLNGTRIYAQLKPGIRYGFNRAEEERNSSLFVRQSFRNFTYFYEPEIGIEYQKAVNLHWQKTFTASLRYQQQFIRTRQKFENPPNTSEFTSFQTASLASFNSSYGFGFYPNNRTLIDGSIYVNSNYNHTNMGAGKAKFFSVQPGLSFSANYFINFRTRAFINTGISWRYTELLNILPTALIYDKTQLNGTINIGFTHIIF